MEIDEWDEPIAEPAEISLPAMLVRLLRASPMVEMPIVLAVLDGIQLDPHTLPTVSAVFEAYRLDRTSAIEAIVRRSPGAVFARDAGERVLRAAGDPTGTDEILRTAAIVTGLKAGRAEASGEDTPLGTAGKTQQPPRKRRGTPDPVSPAAGERFSRCVAALADH